MAIEGLDRSGFVKRRRSRPGLIERKMTMPSLLATMISSPLLLCRARVTGGGTCLNAINWYRHLGWSATEWKLLLNYAVPYLVASHSAAKARMAAEAEWFT